MTPPLIAVLGIGFTEGLLILLIIIFLFGAAKLPALGRAIG
ncbi:MAG: twin-arginine translocase TatA/TatE family subunit, partial [Verrucomicrobiae bacterium]|nr:twin-arginine translocase TatA/TatE family subunit [Verrucomicrobiae bacterium]